MKNDRTIKKINQNRNVSKREVIVSGGTTAQWDHDTLLIMYQQKEKLKLASKLDLGPIIHFKEK